jgi:hypothetical protein
MRVSSENYGFKSVELFCFTETILQALLQYRLLQVHPVAYENQISPGYTVNKTAICLGDEEARRTDDLKHCYSVKLQRDLLRQARGAWH